MDHVTLGRSQTLSREQFEAFYQATMPALRSYLCSVTGNAAIADDILQESYIRLLSTSIPALDERQRKSYLYRVATNLITDYHRAQERARRWWSQTSRFEEAADSGLELTSDIRSVFARMSTRERALLWLAYVAEAEHREIAKILRVKEKSVKVLLYRARRKMETILRDHGFETGHG